MASLKLLLICEIIYWCVLPSLQLTVQVLAPTKEGPEVGIILAPAAHIAADAYTPLARTIQEQSPLRVWIALLDGFTDGNVNTFQLRFVVPQALTALKNKGMKSEDVFMAGHSLGGRVASQYCQTYHKQFKGLLLFGSYIAGGTLLHDYPIPVLTISGDLDGLTRITRIQQTFAQLMEDYQKNNTAYTRTPVITLQGVNHGQFASGQMPDLIMTYDLEPEVSNQTAYLMIAKYTNAFMAVNMLMNNTYRQNATSMLYSAYGSTLSIMQPLTDTRSVTINKNAESTWTGLAQLFVAANPDTAKLKNYIASGYNTDFEVFPTQKDNFHILLRKLIVPISTINKEVGERELLTSYPEYTLKNGILDITTKTEVTLQLNPLDVSTFYSSPIQLQAEMMSSSAIKALLPNATFVPENTTCKDINKVATLYAFSQCSDMARDRYSKRGRPILLSDDISIPTVPLWYTQEMQLNDVKNGLNVTSYSVEIPYKSSQAKTTGLFYCKLLDPYRAMEWIYVDSLRKYDGP